MGARWTSTANPAKERWLPFFFPLRRPARAKIELEGESRSASLTRRSGLPNVTNVPPSRHNYVTELSLWRNALILGNMATVIAFPLERRRPVVRRHVPIFEPRSALDPQIRTENAMWGYAAVVAGAFTGVLQVMSM
jgi:hypothetical protein